MDNKPAKQSKMQEYSLASASSIMNLSNELAKFIKDKKLCMNIQGKEYVLVEAWTFAGMSMGLCPVVTDLINESTNEEVKYRAVVELLNIHTNTVVGRGFAVCSNKEKGKKFFDEYAIASMAQTRATGKAYRLPLGFLMKAAGYEATPAEEMDFQSNTAEAPKQETPKQAAPPTPEPATDKQKELIVTLI
ncbi:hypothetical protein, partial [Adhaeribacter aquaticus]|uniref:hypothetical protein n=1 Tax=Adhaeribacter aquaticus TaxID=299567 RepID=UPI00068872E2